MRYTLECNDLGFKENHTITGKTMEELMEKTARHGKTEHGLTDEQLNDPVLKNKIRSKVQIKEE